MDRRAGFGSVDGGFGSIGLIINSSDGGSDDDFFLMDLLRWRCFSFGLGLVLVLVYVFSSILSHSLTPCWPKQRSDEGMAMTAFADW